MSRSLRQAKIAVGTAGWTPAGMHNAEIRSSSLLYNVLQSQS